MRRSIRIVTRGAAFLMAVLASVVVPAWPGRALADVPLYEASVPLKGTTAEDRAVAMAAALRAVAVRASGRRDAANNPVITAADPARYVQRYSATAQSMLKVGFDGALTEQLLQQAGLPLWPAERPLTIIDAAGVDPAAAEAAAQWRGLPIAWSSGPVPVGAARAVLTGVPGGAGFAWTLTHEGRTVQGSGSVRDGIDLAADTLAARYAPASTRTTSRIPLRIGGMDGLADYSALVAYLRSLSLVRDVQVESLQGSVITLQALVRGDRELLARVAAFDGRLQPAAAAADGTPAAVDFVFDP